MVKDQHNIVSRISYWLVVITITILISKYFVSGPVFEMPRHTLGQLMSGTAHKPFVYRVFVPLLVRIAVQIFPLSSKFYASLLIFLSLFGFVMTLRSFSALFWQSTKIVDFISIISLIMLLPLTITSQEVYDFSTLFLFTLQFYLMVRAKWKGFFPVYIISCLNKETTALLILVFLICFWHRHRDKLFWKLLLLQAIIFIVVRLAIMWQFQNNPGESIENHLEVHLRALLVEPVIVLIYIFFGLTALVAATRDWQKKPLFIRQACLSIAPILFLLYLLGGYPLEIRVFYEAYPLILLLALPSVLPGLDKSFRAVQNPEATDQRSLSLYVKD